MKLNSTLSAMSVLVVPALLASGCNSNSKSAQPGTTGQPQSGPAWTLTLKSACPEGTTGAAVDQCLAKYGFSVNADGKFQVGPGPQGQLRTGTLSDAEFAQVGEKLQAVLPEVVPLGSAAGAASAERHQSGVENVSDDTLTLTTPDAAEHAIAHNVADEFYYTTLSVDSAKSLHDAIRDLAINYYRLPFGDTCGNIADEITAAAATYTSCQVDSDCVYVDAQRGFSVVPPSSEQWILSEDCTAVKPAVVANKLSILGGAGALQKLYTKAREACGGEFYQSTFGSACSYDQKSTAVQPVCVQNRCQSRLQ